MRKSNRNPFGLVVVLTVFLAILCLQTTWAEQDATVAMTTAKSSSKILKKMKHKDKKRVKKENKKEVLKESKKTS